MIEKHFSQLLETISATSAAYHKLTILVGTAGAGKTRLLKEVAGKLNLPLINLSLLLSQRLLGQSRRQRLLNAESIAIEVIDEHITTGLCLDNTELLFDSSLQLNPVVFLQDISRNRLIVATWNGSVSRGELRYAHSGHPDYFNQLVSGYPVISLADDKLQVHLST